MGKKKKQQQQHQQVCNNNLTTALHLAAAENRLEDVEAILEKEDDPQACVNAGDDKMRRPLHLAAARSNSLEVMSLLVEAGAHYDLTDAEGQTPLYIASATGRVENVALLAEFGADPFLPETARGWTPLHASASGNHVCIMEMLLQNGLAVDAVDNSSATALLVGVENKAEEAVDFLLDNGANVNVKDYHDRLPIWVAVHKDSLKIVKRLLREGAKVDHRDSRGSNLLFAASTNKTCDVTKVLLEAGVDVNEKRNDGRTALFNAILKGATAVACELTKHHRDLDELDSETGNAPLHACAVKGLSEVAKALVANGANINMKGAHNLETPLQTAIRCKKINLTRNLISLGADLSVKFQDGESLAFKAIELNVPKLLDPFIQTGMDPNFTDDSGNTAFHFAVWSLNYGVFQMLVDAGADINRKNSNGNTALHLACRVDVRTTADNVKVVNALIDAGADPEVQNASGLTALKVAFNPDYRGGVKESEEVRMYWNSISQALLTGGADPDSVMMSSADNRIRVPLLHIAAGMATGYGDLEAVKMLVEHGANINKLSALPVASAGNAVTRPTVLHVSQLTTFMLVSVYHSAQSPLYGAKNACGEWLCFWFYSLSLLPLLLHLPMAGIHIGGTRTPTPTHPGV